MQDFHLGRYTRVSPLAEPDLLLLETVIAVN